MKIFPLLAVLALGCTGPKESGTTDDSANTNDDSSGGDDSSPGDVKPKVKSVDTLDCTTQQSANDVWSFTVSVDDPQGAETVRTGTVEVQVSGTTLADYTLACRDGMCIGSWRSDYDGIDCTYEGRATLVITVEDEDGNQSAPFEKET
jgi:hypothetical protein